MDRVHAEHEFPPLYDEDSQILILGSFPSIKSREQKFFYGHKQNRFWKMLAQVYGEDMLLTIEEKRAFCKRHRLALYDSIESCDIIGSSDASIRNIEPANLEPIFKASQIKKVIFNGSASKKWFYAFQKEKEGVEYHMAPSTSAANAACKIEQLVEVWGAFLLK